MPPSLDYQARRKADSRKRKQAVLQAAGYCFAERGFKKSTANEIASRAGVSKGLVFHLFGSKDALFEAVIEDSLAQWSLLSSHRASTAGGDIAVELKSLFLASFEFAEKHPMLLLFLREDGAILGQYKNKIARANRHWRKHIEVTLKLGVEQKVFRKTMDVKRTAIVFHELQTVLLQSMVSKGGARLSDRKLASEAVNIFIYGIATPK